MQKDKRRKGTEKTDFFFLSNYAETKLSVVDD